MLVLFSQRCYLLSMYFYQRDWPLVSLNNKAVLTQQNSIIVNKKADAAH